MDGYEYEQKCADLLKSKGFTNVTVTPGSRDQGIDVIAYKSEIKYGVQCKYYTGTVGNKAVQEAYAGAAYYGCAIAMVITNSTLSKSAVALAEELNVTIWEHIDAIYLYENTKVQEQTIDYNLLTSEECEKIFLEEIEVYLQEKYSAFYAKYPTDEGKDAEIERYTKGIREKVDNYESEYQRELNWMFDRVGYQIVKSWRDPVLTPVKNSMREQVKKFGRQLKNILDEVNCDAEQYISSKVSRMSIIKLADTVEYIYSIGSDVVTTMFSNTTFEEREIARFNWPEKYSRIAHKWRVIKRETPVNPEEEDVRKEQNEKRGLELEKTREEKRLKKTLNSIDRKQKFIKSASKTLEIDKEKLKKMEDSYTQRTKELKIAYDNIESELKRKYDAKKSRINELENKKREEEKKLDGLFVFSFKKKEISKQHINSLVCDIKELQCCAEKIMEEWVLAETTYHLNVEDLKMQLSLLRKEIDTHEKELLESETIVKRGEEKIIEIRVKIHALEEELKEFHKKYLLRNYGDIIKKRIKPN